MLEVIAEGTEGLPEDRGEDKTILSPPFSFSVSK